MPQLAVIAGATGYLGGHVIRQAKARGYRVRALARDEARLDGVRELCDEVFVGQATEPSSLDGLYDGADLAFSSIGVRSFGVGKPATFSSVAPWVVRAIAALIYPFNDNAGAFLRMFAMLGEGDVVAPAHGTHRLEELLRGELGTVAGESKS